MPQLSSPSEVLSRLSSSFEQARNSGDLYFYPSTIHKHHELGVEFEITLCPALQKKPTVPTLDVLKDPHSNSKGDPKPDPFAPPYNPRLLVGELKDHDSETEYAVLLNKYSVVPNHFLLVTKEFQPQTQPLLPPDLVQTYLLLAAARKSGKQLLAFYNCGVRSGASQPRKHIQFIPLDDVDAPIDRLARSINLENPDRPFSLNTLPYANHVYRFPYNTPTKPPSELDQILSHAFLSLLDLVISTVRYDPDYPAGPPSYNVILSLEHLHMIPRKEEHHALRETGEMLPVNSLGFAGMLLVKSERELSAVVSEGVGEVLKSVGVNSVHEKLVVGSEMADDSEEPSPRSSL